MKRFMLLLLICLALSGANRPTLNVSCDPCASGSLVTITGTGYPKNQNIEIEATDPDGAVFEGWYPGNGGSFSVSTTDFVKVGQWSLVSYSLHNNDVNNRTLQDTATFIVQ